MEKEGIRKILISKIPTSTLSNAYFNFHKLENNNTLIKLIMHDNDEWNPLKGIGEDFSYEYTINEIKEELEKRRKEQNNNIFFN